MDEIRNQVKRARRRLVLEQFLRIVTWSLFAALLVAVIGVSIPKIWDLNVAEPTWMWSWFAGAIATGLVVAAIWTWVVRRGWLEAAIEIDRRFGLKERVSSALALGPEDRKTEAGQALLDDAARRVAQVDVGERFRVSPNWPAVLPLLPAAALFSIALLIPPASDRSTSSAKEVQRRKEQIQKANEQVKKKLDEQIKKAEEKGLKDAEAVLKELREQADKLNGKENADKKAALLKLNDLKSDLEQQREKLGGADKMRKHFDQLKDMEKGPGDKMASAMKQGDFKKAVDELEKLREQLENGKMTNEQKAALGRQLEQMQDKMQDMKDAHEKAKQDLKKQIQQAKASGNKSEARKLQEKLDQLSMQDEQMQQMQQMADKLGQASQSLKSGDSQQAAAQLGRMSDQLSQMQQQLEQMQTIDEVLDQIADSKDSMNCEDCDGEGCESCRGGGKSGRMGMGSKFGMGDGMGEGQGQGDRPEAETETGEFLSRVGAKPQAGEAVRTGEVGGPNVSGRTKESVKEQVLSSLRADSDPLSNQALPRTEAKHAKEYFEKFRGDGE